MHYNESRENFTFYNSSSGSLWYEFTNDSYNLNDTYYYIYPTNECQQLRHQTFSKTDIFFNTLLPLLCIIGILGIILTMIILSHKSMSTSTNAYLMSMATADLFFLLILSTKYLGHQFESDKNFYIHDVYFAYADIFLQVFFLASIWLTVMLAVERYIAICHPLRAMVICTVRRARCIIIGIYIVSFLCHTPQFWTFKIMEHEHTCSHEILVFVTMTELGRNIMYRNLFSWIVVCSLSAVIPFVLLLYFNCCLIYEIHKSTKHLRYHLAMNLTIRTIVYSEQVKITMMLVSIIIVFFICQAPFILLSTIKVLVEHIVLSQPKYYTTIHHITSILMTLKSLFNFILYCWFSEKFWSTFKRLFCLKYCAKCNKHQNPSSGPLSDHGTNSMRKISVLNTRETIC